MMLRWCSWGVADDADVQSWVLRELRAVQGSRVRGTAARFGRGQPS